MADIYYIPIIQDKETGLCGYVNGAIDRDRDEAIRKTNKHTSIRDETSEIIRIDEELHEDHT